MSWRSGNKGENGVVGDDESAQSISAFGYTERPVPSRCSQALSSPLANLNGLKQKTTGSCQRTFASRYSP